jgi:Ca2+-binding EF-hand superfamily protein
MASLLQPPPPPPPPPSPPTTMDDGGLGIIQEEEGEDGKYGNEINNAPPPPPPPPPPTTTAMEIIDEIDGQNKKGNKVSAPTKIKSVLPPTKVIDKRERRVTKYKNNTRQSMVVKPGELRRRRFTINGSQKEELYSIFTLLDLDMDGRLMPEEVYVAMAAVGITPTEIIKKAIQKRLPKSAYFNGIEFDTFTRIIKSTLTAQPVQRRDLQLLLDHYSNNRDGTIGGEQLRTLLQIPTAANTQLSNKETNQVFAELNLSNDGLIEFGSYVDDVSDGFQRMLDEVPMGRTQLTM